jgi:hypothetical protein
VVGRNKYKLGVMWAGHGISVNAENKSWYHIFTLKMHYFTKTSVLECIILHRIAIKECIILQR